MGRRDAQVDCLEKGRGSQVYILDDFFGNQSVLRAFYLYYWLDDQCFCRSKYIQDFFLFLTFLELFLRSTCEGVVCLVDGISAPGINMSWEPLFYGILAGVARRAPSEKSGLKYWLAGYTGFTHWTLVRTETIKFVFMPKVT